MNTIRPNEPRSGRTVLDREARTRKVKRVKLVLACTGIWSVVVLGGLAAHADAAKSGFTPTITNSNNGSSSGSSFFGSAPAPQAPNASPQMSSGGS